MKVSIATLFATASLLSVSSCQETVCSPVHVLAARGSGEPAGLGGQGRLIMNATKTIPGTSTEAVVYPAILSPYPPSQSAGISAAKEQLTKYVQKCPNSKVILMGYSQGADVVGSAICGSIGFTAVSKAVGSHVVAAVLFGDPRHVAGASFNKGTSTKSGVFPRPASNCASYASRIVSYCDTGDKFCDKGDSVQVHGGYIGRYGTAAMEFMEKQVQLSIPFRGG